MFLSVVIPTYNRLPILRQCLEALERQELAAPIERFEVVLVDDGSTDDTVVWLEANAASLPHLRLIRQDHGGPAEGRNRGVEQARGDVVVFIDSDLVVLPDFLVCHARALEQRKILPPVAHDAARVMARANLRSRSRARARRRRLRRML